MKITVKTVLAFVFIIVIMLSVCSCKTVREFILNIDTENELQEGLENVGLDNENREARIEGAMSKAKDTLKAYSMNRSLAAMDVQPDGTKYVVDANGYFVEFTIENGNLVDTNPDELPTEDPYNDNDDYKRETDESLVKEIRKDVKIYLPAGKN